MSVQNETTWLLGVIKDNWPGASWPSDLVRRNRDNAETLDAVGRREEGVDLDLYNAISVSYGSRQDELFGTTPQYRIQTVLDVRIEGVHEDEHGQITDDDEFRKLVKYTQHAIDTQITYPSVPSTDDIGRVEYLDLRIQDETAGLSAAKDYYDYTFSVSMRGNKNTP